MRPGTDHAKIYAEHISDKATRKLMTNKHWCSLACSLLLTLASSCRSIPSSNSTLDHDLGRYLNESSPYQWVHLSEEQFAQNEEWDPNDLLPATHPARKRLQFWLDQIDQLLRRRDPQAMAQVPKPKAIIGIWPGFSAYVSYAATCLSSPARLEGEGPPRLVESLEFDRPKGFFRQQKPGFCLKGQLTIKQEDDFLRWALSPYPECTFQRQGSELVFPSGCRSLFRIPTAARIDSIAINSTHPFISVYNQVIETLTEEEMLFTLAHEAAHYYMGHAVTPGKLYGQFYKIGPRNSGQKPATDANLIALGQEVESAAGIVAEFTEQHPVPGQTYHSLLFRIARQLTPDLRNGCQGSECRTPCQKLGFHLDTTRPTLEDFPGKPITATARTAYTQFETLLQSCIQDSRSQSDPTLAQSFRYALALHTPALARRVESDIKGLSFSELWTHLQKALPSLQQQARSKMEQSYRQAQSQNLGQYTIEQEADELAIEWLHDLGVAPQIGIVTAFKLLQLQETASPLPTSSGAWGSRACREAYQRGWKDGSGQPLYVPVGDYHDIHHSSCFRAFNLAREIEVHAFRNPAHGSLPTAPGGSWESIQSSLRSR
jgi:hypothetical protein